MIAEPVRLAVLGDPLAYTRSPDLHRAGLAAVGLEGDSRAIPTPADRLGERLEALRREGCLGCNLTMPLKQVALGHVARASAAARAARSINTVGFAADGAWGDSTDGAGFLAWLESLGRSPHGRRVHLLAAGGASRSLALSLRAAGAEVSASARKPATAAGAWGELGRLVGWRTPAEAGCIAACDVLVHASPLADPGGIVPLAEVPPGTLLVDLRYGPEPTPLVVAARARGLEAHDGLGLLVHQAKASLELWLGRPVPLGALEHAVNWRR